MRLRCRNTLALSFAVAAMVAVPPAGAQQLPSFQEIYRSTDVHDLTAWGLRYERGVGVAQNATNAVQLYCKAARKGDVDAKYQLGQMYAFGRGVPRDEALAAAWLYQAAQGNDSRAKVLLKVLNIEGKPKRQAACPAGPAPKLRVASLPHSAETAKVVRLVRALAPKYSLDPNLVLAVIAVESNFNPTAVSRKNAQGIMQLIPATAERFGVHDVWNVEQNLRGGMAYLRWLLNYFNGNVKLALAGYNAGEKAVERHGGVPPYTETQEYVQRIMHRIGTEEDYGSG
jgi:soluble lytic murein transglycosylase-like protein